MGVIAAHVARQLLKDNGIQAVATPDNGIGKLASKLTSLFSREQIDAGEENFN